MRFDVWLKQTTERLSHSSDSARLDAELILMHVLNQPRHYLFTWPEKNIDDQQQLQLADWVERRSQGEPIAHLLGTREFWSLPLAVNNSTLIPRADTEALIDSALTLDLPSNAKVADLGTGTGAIALALASERPNWQIFAVDLVPEAVELARNNADKLGLPVQIYQGNWFEPLTGEYFDLIISNPPYIDANDPHLNLGDVRYEPRSALVSEQSGLADIGYLTANVLAYLNNEGVFIVEHGYQQGEQIRAMFAEVGLNEIKTGFDLAGRERFTIGVKSS